MYKNLIFDLDDTILRCAIHYNECKDDFVEFHHIRTELPKETILKILNDIDLTCTTLPNAFNKERYPRSFFAASLVLDVMRGAAIDLMAADASSDIANKVFEAPYEPYSGAIEMLQRLKDFGYKLFLNTKGDPRVQNVKIDKHDLRRFFEDDCIYIVPKKDLTCLARILADHNIDREDTLSIGDSVRDDIGSAKALGMDSCLIHSHDNKWEYENTDHVATFDLKSIAELGTILALTNDPFRNSLKEASITVARWPEWKRKAGQALIERYEVEREHRERSRDQHQ